MPNWCHNEVTVQGEKKHVKEFMDFVKSDKQEFDFEKIVPLPNGKWDYDWCLSNWNTKWNACDVEKEVVDEFHEVTYTFETAWSPPENILRVLKEKFEESDLFISWFYREDGQELCGYLHNAV